MISWRSRRSRRPKSVLVCGVLRSFPVRRRVCSWRRPMSASLPTSAIESEGVGRPSTSTGKGSAVDFVRVIRRWLAVCGAAECVSDVGRGRFRVRWKAEKRPKACGPTLRVGLVVVEAGRAENRRRQTHRDAAKASSFDRPRYRQSRPRGSVVYIAVSVVGVYYLM